MVTFTKEIDLKNDEAVFEYLKKTSALLPHELMEPAQNIRTEHKDL